MQNLMTTITNGKEMKGMKKLMKQVKEMGKKAKGMVKKAVACVSGLMYSSLAMNVVAFAADDDDKKSSGGDISAITKPLDNLKLLLIAVVGAIGVIILVKNIMEMAQAYQGQDSSGMSSALKGIVAGLMMAGISTVLAILGFA